MSKVREQKRFPSELTLRFPVVGLLACLSVLILFSQSYADTAELVPKGRSMVTLSGRFYQPITERYDPDGNEEPIAINLNGSLNSVVFPQLSLLEVPNLPGPPPFGPGLPPGTASLGDSTVTYEYDFNIYQLTYQYGITDKLSVGVMIPYMDAKNSVFSKLDGSNATVGKDAGYNTFLPLPASGTPGPNPFFPGSNVQLLTTQDGQDLIGPGLDINGDGTPETEGYGYEPIKSWSSSGIGDIEAGLAYQYYKSENWRLACSGAVRFPTGEVDNPDSLVDYGFGTGAWALLFGFKHDYIGLSNLVLNGTFRYWLYLPDDIMLRVPDDVNQPITPNKEKVERDIGDKIELEMSGTYALPYGFSLSSLIRFGAKMKDEVEGNMGFAYESLEAETRAKEWVFIAGLSYSTISLFREKKFPIPMTASLAYRNRFAGSDNVFKSEYIYFALNFFF
jgi:hypothetical protein